MFSPSAEPENLSRSNIFIISRIRCHDCSHGGETMDDGAQVFPVWDVFSVESQEKRRCFTSWEGDYETPLGMPQHDHVGS